MARIVAGANVTLTKDAAADTLAIAAASGASTLDGLSDVVITTPASGQVLTYDGTQWANAAASGGGGSTVHVLPGWEAGRYYGILESIGGRASSSSYALPVDQIQYMPVLVRNNNTVDRIGIQVQTGTAGATTRLGIYSCTADGKPGSLVLDAGTIAGDTAGFKEIIIAQALTGGTWYYLAGVNVNASLSLAYWSFTYPIHLQGQELGANTIANLAWAETLAGSGAALPATATPASRNLNAYAMRVRAGAPS